MKLELTHGQTADRSRTGVGKHELYYNDEEQRLEVADGTADGTLPLMPDPSPYELPAATADALGGVLMAAEVDPASETFAADLVASLQAAGIMASS